MMSSVMSKDECKNSLNIFLKGSNFIKVILWLFFCQNVGPLHINALKTLSCPSYPGSPSCGAGPATSQSPEKEGRILKVEGTTFVSQKIAQNSPSLRNELTWPLTLQTSCSPYFRQPYFWNEEKISSGILNQYGLSHGALTSGIYFGVIRTWLVAFLRVRLRLERSAGCNCDSQDPLHCTIWGSRACCFPNVFLKCKKTETCEQIHKHKHRWNNRGQFWFSNQHEISFHCICNLASFVFPLFQCYNI